VVPAELSAKLPDAKGAIFPTNVQLRYGKEVVIGNWDAAVGADVRPVP